jgi:hypothetical protein
LPTKSRSGTRLRRDCAAAHARTVKSPEALEAALAEGVRVVCEEKRCSVIDARISAGDGP